MLAAAGAVTLGCVAALGGALGVCGWRLGVCARVLSVLVSKLGPVWVGPVESVRARGLGWLVVRLVCVCPAGWAHCGRVVVARVCFRSPFSFASVVEW